MTAGVDLATGLPSRGARRRVTLRRTARRLLALGCLGLAAIGSTGCTFVGNLGRVVDRTECVDDFMLSYRNRVLAEKAWICRAPGYDHIHIDTFKDGFIAGYIDVATGGYGCCPRVAPRKYWGWRYQSQGGQDAVNAWFAGFPLGAAAAEEDGLGHYQHIHVNGKHPMNSPMMPMMSPDGAYVVPGPMPGSGPVPGMSPIEGMAPEVANPFYSDEQDVPEPEVIDAGEPQMDNHRDDAPAPQLNTPDSVQRAKKERIQSANAPRTEEPALVNKSEIARSHEAAVTAKLANQGNVTSPQDDLSIEDVFGPPTAPVTTPFDPQAESDELPFVFE